ncbi:YfeC-like transcriptional regulator [Kosakonia cowanii]|uniref:YfeC-like transcriptional regulator n=1 Tax=Kosakonia cowanii TaxID=208223 RepID=UPI003B21AFAE
MNTLPSKMTTAELANRLGVTRQTINRWIKRHKWKTESLPGVKGGRARYVLITDKVLSLVMELPAMRHSGFNSSLAEPPTPYLTAPGTMQNIINSLQMLTADEMHQLEVLLAREGLSTFCSRLGIKQTVQE